MRIEILVALSIAVIVLAAAFVPGKYVPDQSRLKRFASYSELENFVKANMESYGELGGYFGTGAAAPMMAGIERAVGEPSAGEAALSEDYSTTNIQVAGVDEADIVKSDGKYLYVVSGKNIVIIDAYPAESAKILSKIELNGTLYEIFVNGDKLIVFGQAYEDYYTQTSSSAVGSVAEGVVVPEIGIVPPRYYTPKTFIKVYDISDRQNPVLKRNVSVDGSYFDSRMVGDYVYAIINQNVYYGYDIVEPIPLPVIESDGVSKAVPASDVYYFDFPDSSYIFTNIVAINAQDDAEELNTKTFLMGYSEKTYVSPANIYIAYTKRLNYLDFYDRIIDEAIIPSLPSDVQSEMNEIKNSNLGKYEKMQKIGEALEDYVGFLNPEEAANVMRLVQEKMVRIQEDIAKEVEKTVVHKISINDGQIEYKTVGEVSGYVLNQFSMDEYNGYFRIATTTGSSGWGWRSTSANHLYVLDQDLIIIGKVEDLASGERVFSARFIGDRGYMVTFRQIDPLFVIDLSNPSSPQVLGYLKVTGVSDYLHPYDENHIIGVGREATEQGRIIGMKLSLFDVSDVSNPKEISKYVIGGDNSWVYSEALNDHKAFLFSRSKNLLVIPIQISGTRILGGGSKWESWQGAYVFNLDLSSGFVLKGKITHANETAESEYYYDYLSQVRRSLYIGDVLYTVSGRMIKMNDLSNINNEINKIELPQQIYSYPYPFRSI